MQKESKEFATALGVVCNTLMRSQLPSGTMKEFQTLLRCLDVVRTTGQLLLDEEWVLAEAELKQVQHVQEDTDAAN